MATTTLIQPPPIPTISFTPSEDDSLTNLSSPPPQQILKRKLGDSELSYYLPSKEDGVSDMYLRLTLRVSPHNFSLPRLTLAWSILQIRHPLLAATIVGNYDSFDPTRKGDKLDVEFHYAAPRDVGEALERGRRHVDVIRTPVVRLLGDYLDGPRVLSDELVCKLILCERVLGEGELPTPASEQFPDLDVAPSPSPSPSPDAAFVLPTTPENEQEDDEMKLLGLGPGIDRTPWLTVDLILFCAHFIGDAGAIQFITKELVYLLSFPTSYLHQKLADDIERMNDSIVACGGDERKREELLPKSLEGRLPPIRGKFRNVMSKLDFGRWQSRMIGGQTLPRRSPPTNISPSSQTQIQHKNPTRPTKTLTHELILSKEDTSRIIANCKREGVTVSTALFAVINFAWSERIREKGLEEGMKLPCLMYSARNMRPYLPPKPNKSPNAWDGNQSFYYLSLSYFNVILPSFLPSSTSSSKMIDAGTETPPMTPASATPSQYDSDSESTGDSGRQTPESSIASFDELKSSAPALSIPPTPSSLTQTRSSSPSPNSDLTLPQKIFWHRARLARSQAKGPDVESLPSLVKFVSRTVQMGRARREGSEGFLRRRRVAELQLKAKEEEEKMSVSVSKPGLVSMVSHLNGLPTVTSSSSNAAPMTPPPTPSPTTTTTTTTTTAPKSTPPPARNPLLPPPSPQSALLGLSLLGSFDPLFPPPNQSAPHVSNIAPFEPISLGAGCRLKPGGSLLYAYTFDGRLIVVLGYDAGVLGLDEGNIGGEEGMRGVWEGVKDGIGRWMMV